MPLWFYLLSQSAALGTALVGGVFLAFSDFIMRSLAHTGGRGGVEAMQHINREVFRWLFMALFLGLAPVSVVLAGYGIAGLGTQAGALIALAGLVYLFGCFGVTVVFNVPMNEALGRLDPATEDARTYWQRSYVPRWTFWNSVRALACVAASALLIAGLALV